MLTIEQLAVYLDRLAHDQVQALSAEVKRLEKVRTFRTMTPDEELRWMGETLDQGIYRRLQRKASLESAATMIARRHSLGVDAI